MGTDADPELILDKALLAPDPERNRSLREWVDRCFELWDGGARREPGAQGIELLTSMVTSPLELRSLLRGEIADGRPRGRAPDRRAAVPPQHAARRAARGHRRWRRDGQDDARDRQGEAARDGGLRHAARLLQLAARAAALRRDRSTSRRGPGISRCGPSTSLPRTSVARPARCPPKPEPVTARMVRDDAARRARCGDRAARSAVPRDRRRRGPGLRHRVAGVARGAAPRWSRGRPLRLPRPGAVDLPRRPDRGAGPDRIPPRLQLPQRAADPRPDRAARPGRAGDRGHAVATAGRPSSSRPRATPRPSRRCGASCIGW